MMTTHSLIVVCHLLAMSLWLGGLAFQWAVLAPVAKQLEGDRFPGILFVNAAMGFRWVQWGALALIALTGLLQIMGLGGMKALPVPVHIKITLALVMVLLTLYNTLSLTPKLAQALTANDEALTRKTYGLLSAISWVVLLLGLGILALLGASGLV
ncbi:MAG: CopD family protein [Candidatus Melainabacteria bacterium]|nr:CopD family protein [Candidatus Melainabacteria bacterium]